MAYLGIDTSNYTSSVALLSDEGDIIQRKAPLEVGSGKIGLRQSDAVFAHVRQLGSMLEEVIGKNGKHIHAVGVSVSPRDEAGSYMPCFLAGKLAAQAVAAALGAPVYSFSHQSGHVAAALYGAGRTELFEEEFLALHLSGGTTQCLRVLPGGGPFFIETVAETLDLNAGQVIDRVGAMLGLGFPAGPQLEALTRDATRKLPVKVTFKGRNCCLSGVENQCESLLRDGNAYADVALFCIRSVERAALGMCERVLKVYPGLKVVCAGGVMSNSLIRESFLKQFGAAFASPEFSADNAAGVAVLCGMAHRKAQNAKGVE